jgi:hypothetical protein
LEKRQPVGLKFIYRGEKIAAFLLGETHPPHAVVGLLCLLELQKSIRV